MATASGRLIASETTNLEDAMAEVNSDGLEAWKEGLFRRGGDALRELVQEMVQQVSQGEAGEQFGALPIAPGRAPPSLHQPPVNQTIKLPGGTYRKRWTQLVTYFPRMVKL